VTSQNVLGQITPSSNGGLALVAHNGQLSLVTLLGVDVGVDVEHDDGTQMTHTLLRHTEQLAAVGAELNALDGCRELPSLEETAGLDLPKSDGVVGAAGGDHGACRVDIDGPDGTDVALVCSETFAIVREPHANLLILGDGEEQVAVGVESGIWSVLSDAGMVGSGKSVART
jgi:hypothetical protein